MDDFLKKNEIDTQEGPPIEHKKIEFKHIKEKKCMRTYIFNLEHFIEDEDVRDDLMKNLKKVLGTACIQKDTEFGPGYGFNGDFRNKIKAHLINNNLVKIEDFK